MPPSKAILKAEEKIQEALRLGAVKLDLSAEWSDSGVEKLAELPESLGQLTQLQELDLSDNQLTALPEWLAQFTQLQRLDLSNNQLKAVPEWLGQLKELCQLELRDNQLVFWYAVQLESTGPFLCEY